jgi:hypothetical protein
MLKQKIQIWKKSNSDMFQFQNCFDLKNSIVKIV